MLLTNGDRRRDIGHDFDDDRPSYRALAKNRSLRNFRVDALLNQSVVWARTKRSVVQHWVIYFVDNALRAVAE